MNGGINMDLMDLALEIRDFEWAKELYDKYYKNKDEIKCELSEINMIKRYIKSLSKKELMSILKEEDFLTECLLIAWILIDTNEGDKKDFIKNHIKIYNDQDIEIMLTIIDKLNE